jgi:ribosomal protein S18 acetylase RimI-like enzyme
MVDYMLGNHKIIESDFQEVLPIWIQYLWPKRRSRINPINTFSRNGETSPSIPLNANPYFWKCTFNDKIVGVLSGYTTEPAAFRIRGLYVDPAHRLNKVGSQLVSAAIEQALLLNHDLLWTAPRLSAWQFYSRLGFKQTKEFQDANFEFGPNCFAELDIRSKIRHK